MPEAPRIAGRFEYDPATHTLVLHFNHLSSPVVLGEGDDANKALRGAVPVKFTGGYVMKKDDRTWSEQMAGVWLKEHRPKRAAKPAPLDLKGKTKEELEALLADVMSSI